MIMHEFMQQSGFISHTYHSVRLGFGLQVQVSAVEYVITEAIEEDIVEHMGLCKSEHVGARLGRGMLGWEYGSIVWHEMECLDEVGQTM